MTDNIDNVECIVIALVEQFVRTAVRVAHDYAEGADILPDMPSVETWRGIAEAIDNPEAVRTACMRMPAFEDDGAAQPEFY